MATNLTTDEMKEKVRSHFEDFVNNRKAEVIRTNMTPDFYDHDGPGGEPTDASGIIECIRRIIASSPDPPLGSAGRTARRDKRARRSRGGGAERASGKAAEP